MYKDIENDILRRLRYRIQTVAPYELAEAL